MFTDAAFIAAGSKLSGCHQNGLFCLLSIQMGSLLAAIGNLCFLCLEQCFCLFNYWLPLLGLLICREQLGKFSEMGYLRGGVSSGPCCQYIGVHFI